MDGINREYLNRFPTKLREYLSSSEKKYRKFFDQITIEYDDIKVYRAIHFSDKVCPEDFLCNVDDADHFDLVRKPQINLNSLAVSVNESLQMLEKTLSIPNKGKKLFAVAEGTMRCKYGPAEFDGDRPHHNWYLYDDSRIVLSSEFKVCKSYE